MANDSAPTVAVFGTGLPALTTAYFLAKFNHTVTVYDHLTHTQSLTQHSAQSDLVSNHLAAQPLPKPAIYINTLCKLCPVYSYRHPSFNVYGSTLNLAYWRQLMQHSSAEEYGKSYTLLHQLTALNTSIYDNLRGCDAQTDSKALVHHLYSTKRVMRDIREEQTYRRTNNTAVDSGEKVIDVDELVRLQPSLTDAQADTVAALYAPADYVTDLQQYSRDMYTHCTQQMRVQFQYGVYAQSLTVADDTVTSVQCADDRQILANKYIVCDGVVLKALVPQYAAKQHLALVKHHTLRFDTATDVAPAVSKPEQYLDITRADPSSSSAVVTYGRELIHDVPDNTPTAIQQLYKMTADLVRDCCVIVASVYPRVTVDEISQHGKQQPIVSYTTITTDGLPLCGQLQPYKNLYVNLAHGMHGNALIHSTALLVAQLAAQEKSLLTDPRPFKPNRFV